MKIIKVSYFKLKARFNKLADFNEKIAELHQLFSNYFINTVEISNVLSLVSDSSELSNTEITDNSNIYTIDTINLNSSDAVVNSVIITSLNLSKKTSIKKIMM